MRARTPRTHSRTLFRSCFLACCLLLPAAAGAGAPAPEMQAAPEAASPAGAAAGAPPRALPAPAPYAPDRPMQRRADPVEVKGRYLDPFLGTENRCFDLLAWRGAAFCPVPFQVDERTPDGKMVLTAGPEARPEDGNNRLDPQDELVFMAADAGFRAPPAARAGGLPGRTLEIGLEDPVRGERAWLYLNADPSRTGPAPTEPKVRLIEGADDKPYALQYRTGMVRGRVNRHGGKSYQTPLYDAWVCNPAAGGSGQDLLDAMKVRLKLGFLFNSVKFSFDETSLLGGIDALRFGPVRGAGRFWMRGVLPLGIKSPRAYMDVYLYDTMVLVPGTFEISGGKKHVLSSMEITVGYDLSEAAKGMKFYNSNNLDGFVIDGRMSGAERDMDDGLDEWRVVVGPQGAMITASVWDESYKEQAHITVHLTDDQEALMPPEDTPGSIGFHYNTSRVGKLEEGTYHTLLCWFYPEDMYDPVRLRREVIDEYLAIRRQPLKVRVGPHAFDNPAGWPAMIDPET